MSGEDGTDGADRWHVVSEEKKRKAGAGEAGDARRGGRLRSPCGGLGLRGRPRLDCSACLLEVENCRIHELIQVKGSTNCRGGFSRLMAIGSIQVEV
ncbi:hypothetical protein GUJ93_ZPchr0010g7978 [Zizania palustris]|uniref:Uncharacterized protein n=1 Tax=Zizania palustris TaxID=103762 RepID=A0A8J5WBM0_ZIZPA|nr:hypothetical protein GUJ93_ZPchr0010g7978 [Zizania palustris]